MTPHSNLHQKLSASSEWKTEYNFQIKLDLKEGKKKNHWIRQLKAAEEEQLNHNKVWNALF